MLYIELEIEFQVNLIRNTSTCIASDHTSKRPALTASQQENYVKIYVGTERTDKKYNVIYSHIIMYSTK